ncbi:hypothetical protein [Synechococcus sp. M16CYN]|uniref:hypothetical protein n=1 Tax=Synechococcus sp. M16CYN TaxID=3103139 RepID=UPI0033405FE6
MNPHRLSTTRWTATFSLRFKKLCCISGPVEAFLNPHKEYALVGSSSRFQR